MKSSNAMQLLNCQARYKGALSRWEQFADHVSEYCRDLKLADDSPAGLPMPDICHEDNSIEIQFTDVKLKCQFQCLEHGSQLLFGYLKAENGLEKFTVTKAVFLSDGGDILQSKGGKAGDFHLVADEAVNGVFFAGCKQALNTAWRDREEDLGA